MNDNEQNPLVSKLSRKGQATRDRMLVELQLEMLRFHTRRNIHRWVAGSAVVVIAAMTFWQFSVRNHQPADSVAAIEQADPGFSPAIMHPLVVSNQPDVLDRFLVTDSSFNGDLEIEVISDEELLGWMNQAGKPSFLGRIDGELVVVPRKSL